LLKENLITGPSLLSISDITWDRFTLPELQALPPEQDIPSRSKLNNKRRIIARKYDKEINNKNFTKLTYAKNSVYHQYVLLVKNRDKFAKFLDKHKIGYGFHYPFSINQLKVFRNKFKNNEFKNSNKLAKNGISLPIDPNLSNKQLNYIVNKINSF